MKRYVRLRDAVGMFHDPETGFSLKASQVKLLPAHLGLLTRTWLNSGGLVLCNSPDEPGEVVVEEQHVVELVVDEDREEEEEADDSVVESVAEKSRVDDLLELYDRDGLLELARQMNVKVGARAKAETIAKRIAEAEETE